MNWNKILRWSPRIASYNCSWWRQFIAKLRKLRHPQWCLKDKSQSEGIDCQHFIRTDKRFIFLLKIFYCSDWLTFASIYTSAPCFPNSVPCNREGIFWSGSGITRLEPCGLTKVSKSLQMTGFGHLCTLGNASNSWIRSRPKMKLIKLLVYRWIFLVTMIMYVKYKYAITTVIGVGVFFISKVNAHIRANGMKCFYSSARSIKFKMSVCHRSSTPFPTKAYQTRTRKFKI